MSGEDPEAHDTESTSPASSMMRQGQNEEINLVDLTILAWRHRWSIVAIVLLSLGCGAAYLLIKEPVYRAEVLLSPNQSERGPNFAAQLGGLADLAGLSLGTASDATEAIAFLRSRAFATAFIVDNDLMSILYSHEWDEAKGTWQSDSPEDWPDLRDAAAFFGSEVLFVEEDVVTGLVTLAIEWTDAETAAAWAEDLIDRINSLLRQRDLEESQRRLVYLNDQLEQAHLVELRQAVARLIENETQTIMLAQADREYAFKVIDPPQVPHKPAHPRKVLVLIVSMTMGLLLALIVVLIVSLFTISREQKID